MLAANGRLKGSVDDRQSVFSWHVIYSTSVEAVIFTQSLAVKPRWENPLWVLHILMHERAAAALQEHSLTPTSPTVRDPGPPSYLATLIVSRSPKNSFQSGIRANFQGTPLDGAAMHISHRFAPEGGGCLQAVVQYFRRTNLALSRGDPALQGFRHIS